MDAQGSSYTDFENLGKLFANLSNLFYALTSKKCTRLLDGGHAFAKVYCHFFPTLLVMVVCNCQVETLRLSITTTAYKCNIATCIAQLGKKLFNSKKVQMYSPNKGRVKIILTALTKITLCNLS